MGFFDALVGWAMAPTDSGERPQEVPSPQQVGRMDPTWQDLQSRSDGNPYQQVPMPPNIQQQIQAPDQGGGFPGGRPIPLPPTTTGQVGQTQAIPQQQASMLPGQSSATYKPGTDPDQAGITWPVQYGGVERPDVLPRPGGQIGGVDRPDVLPQNQVPIPPVRPGNLGQDTAPTTSQGADVSVGPRQGVPGQSVPTPPADLGRGLNLAQRLGISMDPARVERMKASLGAGLKSVGDNWNKPGLAAFAGSAGSALQGDVKEGDVQAERELKATNQYFTQASTAFNDQLKAKQQGDLARYQASHGAYWDAMRDAIDAGAKTGKIGKQVQEAWQKSDVGRLHMADQAIQKWEDGELRKMKLRTELMVPEKKQALLDDLDERKKAKTKELYKNYDVDPEKIEMIRTRGQTPTNPFKFGQDYKTRPEFEAAVPVGGHYLLQKGETYKDKNGKEQVSDGTTVMIRKQPEEQQ